MTDQTATVTTVAPSIADIEARADKANQVISAALADIPYLLGRLKAAEAERDLAKALADALRRERG